MKSPMKMTLLSKCYRIDVPGNIFPTGNRRLREEKNADGDVTFSPLCNEPVGKVIEFQNGSLYQVVNKYGTVRRVSKEALDALREALARQINLMEAANG